MKKLAVIVLIFTFSKSFAIDFEFEGVMEGLKSDERDINFSGSIECDESGTYQYQKTGIPIPLTSLPIFRELQRSSENMLFWVEGNVDKKSGAFILEYHDGNLRGVWTDFKAYRRVRIQPKKIAFLRGIVEADSKEYVVSRKMESADEEAFFIEIDGLPEHRLTSERRCQGVYGIDMVWVKKSDLGYEVEWRGNSPGQAGVEYRDNKIISVGEVNNSSGRPLEAAAESES